MIGPSAGVMPSEEAPGRREPCEDAAPPLTTTPTGASVFPDAEPALEGLPTLERAKRFLLGLIGRHPPAVDAHLASVRLAEERERRPEGVHAPDWPAEAAQGPPEAIPARRDDAAEAIGRAAAAPSLDTLGITRQTEAAIKVLAVSASKAASRKRWLQAVAGPATPYCERKASGLDAIAQRRRRAARAAGLSDRAVHRAGKWHADRAKGYRFRFANVDACGKDGPKELQVSCTECGSTITGPITCGCSLLCIHCRGRLQRRRRESVAQAQETIRDTAKRLGLTRRGRRTRGGRWSGKFVTLTIPHEGLDRVQRIALVHAAMPHFGREVGRWFASFVPKNLRDLVLKWYGSHEWTAGSDGLGHPHVHFWIFSPRIPQLVLTDAWHRALERAGLGELRLIRRTREDSIGKYRTQWEYDGPQLEVDVREEREVKGGVCELVKYILKDTEEGDFLEPAAFAETFEALDGRRMRKGSPGFLALGVIHKPCACGAVECWQVRVTESPMLGPDAPDAPRKRGRGPPGPGISGESLRTLCRR